MNEKRQICKLELLVLSHFTATAKQCAIEAMVLESCNMKAENLPFHAELVHSKHGCLRKAGTSQTETGLLPESSQDLLLALRPSLVP